MLDSNKDGTAVVKVKPIYQVKANRYSKTKCGDVGRGVNFTDSRFDDIVKLTRYVDIREHLDYMVTLVQCGKSNIAYNKIDEFIAKVNKYRKAKIVLNNGICDTLRDDIFQLVKIKASRLI